MECMCAGRRAWGRWCCRCCCLGFQVFFVVKNRVTLQRGQAQQVSKGLLALRTPLPWSSCVMQRIRMGQPGLTEDAVKV